MASSAPRSDSLVLTDERGVDADASLTRVDDQAGAWMWLRVVDGPSVLWPVAHAREVAAALGELHGYEEVMLAVGDVVGDVVVLGGDGLIIERTGDAVSMRAIGSWRGRTHPVVVGTADQMTHVAALITRSLSDAAMTSTRTDAFATTIATRR